MDSQAVALPRIKRRDVWVIILALVYELEFSARWIFRGVFLLFTFCNSETQFPSEDLKWSIRLPQAPTSVYSLSPLDWPLVHA